MFAATAQSRSCRLNACAPAGRPNENTTKIAIEISRAGAIICRFSPSRRAIDSIYSKNSFARPGVIGKSIIRAPSNAGAIGEPHGKFSFYKRGFRGRIGLPHLAGQFPPVEVSMIYRVLTDRMRRAEQGSEMLPADRDLVI
jgi:hypothetical protein